MSLLELYGAPVQIRTSFVTRQHPDCQHPRKQVACPNGHGWQDLTHNAYCHDCALWLVEEQPAAVVAEPAVVETAEQVQAGIEHYKSVLAQWDETVEESTVAQLSARIDNVPATIDAQLAETATQAEETHIVLPQEHRPFVHMVAETDEPRYGLKAEQAYYLCRSESLSRCAEQSVYHIVVWDYEQCRWLCPCEDPHRQCKHVRTINQDCKRRAIEADMATVLATFRQVMDKNGCCEHGDLVKASGLDSLKVKQAIRFLNDAGQNIVWMRSEFPYWQWHNITQEQQAA